MTTRSVPAGSSRSACQTMAGSRPPTWASARAMSRSRLMPGKTKTADFMAAIPRSPGHFDAVILDHRVGEQLFGRSLERTLGAGAVLALDLDVEHFALPHAGDAADAERFQRALDRLALRIQNPRFQGDGDAGFHQGAPGRAGAGLTPSI